MTPLFEFLKALFWLGGLVAIASAGLGLVVGFCWGIGSVLFGIGRSLWI